MENDLKKESEIFDRKSKERIENGFIPDLRRLKKVKWFYNNVWRDPEFVSIHLMHSINFVLELVSKSGGRVLEIGCGFGYLSLEIARLNLDVTGIDLSPYSIKIAKETAMKNPYKENFGSLKYLQGDILSMELERDYYDSVIFYGTLHHMPDLDLVLSKVYNSLKVGGNLIICEPVVDNFTKDQAIFSAIIRAILPTWISYENKLNGLDNPKAWEEYIQKIYDEYVYEDEFEQSPFDNSSSSQEMVLNSIEKYFGIKKVKYSDAFIDKIIGGLRGEDKYLIARFLKFVDDDLIRRGILAPTTIWVHAVK